MSTIVLFLVMCIAVTGIIFSILLLLRNKPMIRGKQISLRNFFVLLLVYVTVMLGFGCIYIGLELMGITVLTENNFHVGEGSFWHLLEDAMYFSAVTLLSVGYGDITPLGIGRWFAIIEALFGYLLPAAFVVSHVMHYDRAN